jgi:hypothetical protein
MNRALADELGKTLLLAGADVAEGEELGCLPDHTIARCPGSQRRPRNDGWQRQRAASPGRSRAAGMMADVDAGGLRLAVRSGCDARPETRGIPCNDGKYLQKRRCRRRDSNPRHADYDYCAIR